MTIYSLYDLDRAETYLWTVAQRDDTAAFIKARGLLEGNYGRLYQGPTGVDRMEYLTAVTKGMTKPAKNFKDRHEPDPETDPDFNVVEEDS